MPTLPVGDRSCFTGGCGGTLRGSRRLRQDRRPGCLLDRSGIALVGEVSAVGDPILGDRALQLAVDLLISALVPAQFRRSLAQGLPTAGVCTASDVV